MSPTKPPTCNEIAGGAEAWPNCSVPDCENKANMWLGHGKCYPHTLEPFGLDPTWFAEKLKGGLRPWDAETEARLTSMENAAAKAAP